MQIDVEQITLEANSVVTEVAEAAGLCSANLLVVGCSTSEVLGEHIGKAGSEDVARAVIQVFLAASERYGFTLAFQCCEHLNRALVVEDTTRVSLGLEQVIAVPVPAAGGATAATAYQALEEPVLVEHIQADAGVDIGSTLIGMHLRHVAVPFRPVQRTVGVARVTAAVTRPKLIGGARAVYKLS